MLSSKLLILATTALFSVTVNAGIDIWRSVGCHPEQDWQTFCDVAIYALPWWTKGCDISPYTTFPQFEPHDMAYGDFPGHMWHPGVCDSAPLDFYDTGDGYDVYFSGGDGTLLGHCNWDGGDWWCGAGTNYKYYSCDIPVC